MVNISSFSSASEFPTKLLHQNAIENGKIIPLHIQLIPTNDCNLNCKFCSCSDRDKKKKLELEEIFEILNICVREGTKAMTITGGGDPLMYNRINGVISYANLLKIKVGLVTNGTLFKKLKYHPNLTWCRISSSDDRIPDYDSIRSALEKNPKTDWAFSHVITKNPNYNIIKDLISFANDHKFTHIRLVSDLCDLKNVPDMKEVKKKLENVVDDSLVIYQGRKDSTKGTKNCYISLLKPVIGPEGIFPCCGTNYAIKGMKRKPIDQMKMGDIKDLDKILNNQECFNGSKCDVCYYSQYNLALKKLLNKPDHLEFV